VKNKHIANMDEYYHIQYFRQNRHILKLAAKDYLIICYSFVATTLFLVGLTPYR